MLHMNPATGLPWNEGDAETREADESEQSRARLSGLKGFEFGKAAIRHIAENMPQREKARLRRRAVLGGYMNRARSFCARNAVFLPYLAAIRDLALVAVWIAIFWFFWAAVPS